MTENLEGYLDQELTGLAITKAYFFMLPQFIQWAFPVAGLVAVVFTIQTMTLHREIVAAKAGGISFHRLILPLIGLGVFLTVVALGLAAVVPRANTIASEILQKQEFRTDYRGNFSFQGEGGRNFNVRNAERRRRHVERSRGADCGTRIQPPPRPPHVQDRPTTMRP